MLFLQLGYATSQGAIVKCHVDEACPGGPDSNCTEGYSGRRCGECSVGYYTMSNVCRQCGSQASSAILIIVLALALLISIAFFEWQSLRDPRIGSPLVLIMRLLETLGVFASSVARWPGSIPVFLSITSLVNLNTEVFQIECLLGRSHPTGRALTYILGVAVLLLVLLLFYPLLQLWKRCIHYDCEASPSLESLCEPVMPGNASIDARLPFTPIQALLAATFKEYVQISLVVSLPSQARAAERHCPAGVASPRAQLL